VSAEAPETAAAPASRSLGRRAGVALGGVIAAFVVLVGLAGLLQRTQWVAYHALFEARGALDRPTDVVLVAIDEASLAELGAWPLPRAYYGRLVDGLREAGATTVGIDVTFVQPAPLPADDQAFAAALARWPGKVVLAATLQPTVSAGHSGREAVLPRPELRAHAEAGVVDLPFDVDGGVHSFDRIHVAARAFEGFDWAIARRHLGRGRSWLDDTDGWLIDYAGPPGWITSMSLVSLMDAVAAKDERILKGIRGKAVIVGATARRFQDQYPTPYAATLLGGGAMAYMPGAEIHANAVATLLRGTPIHKAPWWLEAGQAVALGAAAGATFVVLAPWWAAGLLLLGVLGSWLLSQLLFTGLHVWLDPVVPVVVLALVWVVGVGAQYVAAETHRRLYRRTFERYVSKDIVDLVLEKPWLAPKLGGEQREVTILFSDIRSFTTISEQRTPEEVVAFLNAYLTAMAQVIHKERGSIDKYIGDAIMALWGNVIPMPPEEAARRAVRAGLAMHARLDVERPGWEARGFPRLDIGVGINTGQAVVGNIGSPEKLEFGVIGDAVNVASRLEGMTKEYGGLLVSGRTRELLGEAFTCTYMATVKVKGREQPVDIFRVDGEVSG